MLDCPGDPGATHSLRCCKGLDGIRSLRREADRQRLRCTNDATHVRTQVIETGCIWTLVDLTTNDLENIFRWNLLHG